MALLSVPLHAGAALLAPVLGAPPSRAPCPQVGIPQARPARWSPSPTSPLPRSTPRALSRRAPRGAALHGPEASPPRTDGPARVPPMRAVGRCPETRVTPVLMVLLTVPSGKPKLSELGRERRLACKANSPCLAEAQVLPAAFLCDTISQYEDHVASETVAHH